MKMILFTFLLILPLTGAATGKYQAVCPTPLIEAEEGDDVFLWCHLDPPISLSAYTVDWKTVDDNKVLYSYRHGQKNGLAQAEQYRHRTSLNPEDLSRGNMTLNMSSVQLSDSARYKCFVPKLKASCIVNLSVVPKDQRNRTKTDDFTTTTPPHEEPANPDYKTIEIVLAVVISTAVVSLLGVLAWISRRKIRMLEEGAASGDGKPSPELKRLSSPLRDGDRDLNGAAASGLGDNQ